MPFARWWATAPGLRLARRLKFPTVELKHRPQDCMTEFAFFYLSLSLSLPSCYSVFNLTIPSPANSMKMNCIIGLSLSLSVS